MKNIKLYLIFVILILVTKSIFAQETVFDVRGRIVDSIGKPIQFAHIINLKKHSGCISDTAGYFRILMLSTDTVKISCLGFKDSGFTLNGIVYSGESNIIQIADITLKSTIYLLGVVNVFQDRWNSFLYDYTHRETIDDLDNKNIENWKKNLISPQILRELTVASRGVGFPLNFTRKKEKALKRIDEFNYQEELSKEANEKYNPQIVAQITGMSEDDAELFIKHFKLSRDYILQKSDYDLYIIIKQLYKEYSKNK
ncbi:MAG: carboxypeptidase-like regulatory domain-containing protein [Bacteroidales bacterium]|nr:carboxypeptidase-like regulatory domain-containing protein [Bacteroidales bacterium]